MREPRTPKNHVKRPIPAPHHTRRGTEPDGRPTAAQHPEEGGNRPSIAPCELPAKERGGERVGKDILPQLCHEAVLRMPEKHHGEDKKSAREDRKGLSFECAGMLRTG